jgi:predicted ester cyclase
MPAQDVVERRIKAFNDHDARGWAAPCAPSVVVLDPQYTEPLRGREAVQKDIADFFVTFPDIAFRVTNQIVSGDQVALEGAVTGTHRGPMETPGGTLAPTNKRATIPVALFMRVDRSEQVVEEHRYYDLAGMMQQLGLAAP